MNEQRENIERVSTQIAGYVTKFIDAHLDKEFRVEELHKYVASELDGYVAPGSPDRIMRLLKQQGRVDYIVLNRRRSLYKAIPITEQRSLF